MHGSMTGDCAAAAVTASDTAGADNFRAMVKRPEGWSSCGPDRAYLSIVAILTLGPIVQNLHRCQLSRLHPCPSLGMAPRISVVSGIVQANLQDRAKEHNLDQYACSMLARLSAPTSNVV